MPYTKVEVEALADKNLPVASTLVHVTGSKMQAGYHERYIWVTFQKAGFHRYPNAPEDVSYLQNVHRHLFKFKVTLQVLGDNREVEFHQFLRWCEAQYSEGNLVLDHQSCEMIGDALLEKIKQVYGADRRMQVEVSEDSECGSICSWLPVL